MEACNEAGVGWLPVQKATVLAGKQPSHLPPGLVGELHASTSTKSHFQHFPFHTCTTLRQFEFIRHYFDAS